VAVGYRGKLAERERARDLRAQAWTINEIVAELGVSKSSVSSGCATSSSTKRRGRHGPARAHQLQQRKQAEIVRLIVDGAGRIGDPTDRDLLIAGMALYAGEGAKTDGRVLFANSDPRMVALFLRFLRSFFDVDESRLRLRLYLHAGLDIDRATNFWSGLTAIPPQQFQKPYRAVPDHSIRHAKHPMGCPGIRYSCSKTHRAIMGLVAGLLSSEVRSPG
jgi:hypothetical protein